MLYCTLFVRTLGAWPARPAEGDAGRRAHRAAPSRARFHHSCAGFIATSTIYVSNKTRSINDCSVVWKSYVFPGHALHEKGLQKQKGVGPLVSSQEQRALLVPRINRSSTAGQPRILFPHSVYIGFRLFVLLERRSGNMFSMLWRVRGRLVPCANCSVGVQS